MDLEGIFGFGRGTFAQFAIKWGAMTLLALPAPYIPVNNKVQQRVKSQSFMIYFVIKHYLCF